mmetsp:Transcript_27108/g.39686  ORF Transcript_27108/g.39686 Transcript_27108/m.39686 type:complete len:106 (-) Transcript_27108:635-952(-)
MPWPFCPTCRATLQADGEGKIYCVVCEFSTHITKMHIPTRTTSSLPRPVPLWAKSDQEQKTVREYMKVVRTTVEEHCIKCDHSPVGFYTAQLRSVDEGNGRILRQ